MNIHVTRNGQQYGPYAIDDINTYLRSGLLMPSDLAWHDGITNWLPLSQVEGVQMPPLPPYPPPPPSMPVAGGVTDDVMLRRICDYERLSGILWIVLAILQIISIIGIIAGVWNIFAGISRLQSVGPISRRDAGIPKAFEESLTMLIVIGIINVLFGAVIGILFVAFDFYIRDLVIKNAHVFNVPTEIPKDKEMKSFRLS